jgi:hypothetical protein
MKDLFFISVISPPELQRSSSAIEFVKKIAGRSPDYIDGISVYSSKLKIINSGSFRDKDFEASEGKTCYRLSSNDLKTPNFGYIALLAGLITSLETFVKTRKEFYLHIEDDCDLRNEEFNVYEIIDKIPQNFGIVQLGNSGLKGEKRDHYIHDGLIHKCPFNWKGDYPWRSGSQCILFNREIAIKFLGYLKNNIHNTDLEKSKKFREKPLDQTLFLFVKQEKIHDRVFYWAKTYQNRTKIPSIINDSQDTVKKRKPTNMDWREYVKEILKSYHEFPSDISKWIMNTGYFVKNEPKNSIKKAKVDELYEWLSEMGIDREDFFKSQRRIKMNF